MKIAWGILLASLVWAQNATLSGRITDPAGAGVPGAALVLANTETGVEWKAVTNGEGLYLFAGVPAGRFRLEAGKAGFRNALRDDIVLTVQQAARLDLRLALADVTQQVDVVAETAPVLAESAAVESTVTRDQIETLPLNSRDFNQLVLLAAGAVENINSGNGRDFGGVAVNGNRAFSNDYLLDGVPNNDVYQGRSAVPVSIDLIREFKVTSGVNSAEYGQAGVQVSVVSRGGTNRWRGSLFEYLRTQALQARNPFNNVAPQPFSRHQFGGSLGGPVVKNRTFFFVNYEGNRQRESQTRVATVPLDDFWRGDFSSIANRVTLRDPLLPDRPIIPGNRLDQYLGGARINATARRLQPFWGSPNRPGLVNNAIRVVDEPTDAHQFTARADHQFPRNHQMALRYTGSMVDNFGPSLLANGSGLNRPTDNHNGSLGWTQPWRPNLLGELRFSGASFNSLTTYADGGLPTIGSLNLAGFEPRNPLLPPMPRITFAGGDAFTQLNYGTNANFGMAALKRESILWTVNYALTWTTGRHTIKGGFERRYNVLPALQQTNASGAINFRTATTGIATGYAFADFLMGLPGSTSEVPVKDEVMLRQTEWSSYVQDDWRVHRRLTFSFGARHELFLNPTEDLNRLSMFDINSGGMVVASDNGRLPTDRFLPSVVQRLTDATGRWRFPVLADVEAGYEARRIIQTRYGYVAPRAGLVWQPVDKTLIKAGYGIFYTRYPRQYLLQTMFINPPFAGVFNYNQAASGAPTLTLDRPYPSAGGTASVAPAGMQPDFGLPYNQQWNLTVEREIGWRTVMSLGYVGNRGVHLFRSINANGARLDPATGQVVRRFQNTYGTSAINYRQTDGNSMYHAMLLEVRRRLANGLQFQGNWTWAKGLDDTGQTVQAALLDVENLGRDRADSDYVRRHQVTINTSYELPFAQRAPRVVRLAAAGWRLAGIYRFTTGRYFTPQFTAAGGLANNRPDVVAGVRANLSGAERTRERWFNPAAFAEVPAVDPVNGRPRFGNSGRNTLIGPGLETLDASLAKSFRLGGERRALSVRLEAFNLFNHANYDLPASNISQTNIVGSISDVVVPMRQVQFAFRYDF